MTIVAPDIRNRRCALEATAASTSSAARASQPQDAATRMMAFIERLYPICRSITGPGIRETLAIVGEQLPLALHEVPSGATVLDWQVPPEWTIRDAYIADSSGRRLIDFRQSNLHVVGYSIPVHARVTLAELRPHLHTLPDRPDWIPYRTSYYRETWGFCLSQHQLDSLGAGPFEVCIDSTLAPGSLTYGEMVLPGRTEAEILLSCHICHPQLANDNLSSLAIALELIRWLATEPRRYTYRLVLVPGTIGAITWLAQNRNRLPLIHHGLVLALLGDGASPTYKQSRRRNAEIDRACAHVLSRHNPYARVLDFDPFGYDERQYCSPGFDLPVGRLSRSVQAEYPQYHTSADNLELIRPSSLVDSLEICQAICTALEVNRRYINQAPHGEPQLGKRGLYRSLGGAAATEQRQAAILWLLNLSDGEHDLLAIAEQSRLPLAALAEAASALEQCELLQAAPEVSSAPSRGNDHG